MKLEPAKNPLLKLFWFTLGFSCLAVGVVGLLLPIIPGFLFFIPALFCFAKASDKIHNWLKENRTFGKYFKSK